MSEKLIYTTAELAAVLQVSLPTLRDMIRSDNPPPFIKIGRVYRFPVSEVEKWLSAASCRG